MKMLTFVISAFTAISISGPILAQGAPVPPTMPSMGVNRGGAVSSHVFRIGQTNSTESVRKIGGNMTIVVSVPPEKEVTTLELYVDEKLIKAFPKRPFFTRYDTTSLSNGEHVFKAVGKGADGTAVWNASAKADVSQDAQGSQNSNTSSSPSVPAPKLHTTIPSTNAPVISSHNKIYDGKKYGFTIKYPDSWSFTDETVKLNSKSEYKFWLMLGAMPIDKASIVVNVRGSRLEQGSNVETFIKYNSYVKSWELSTIAGSPAFSTTSGAAASERVVHRAIILKDGSAWMFNCIDTTGGSPTKSKTIFDEIINSFQTVK